MPALRAHAQTREENGESANLARRVTMSLPDFLPLGRPACDENRLTDNIEVYAWAIKFGPV
jgi:hypothetical protein